MIHVWMTEEFRYSRNNDGSCRPPTRAVCAWWYSTGFCFVWLTERPYYMDFLASCHLWWCLLLFELLLLFPPKLQSADQSECGRMGSQTGAALQKQTLLWFIVGESLTHCGCIDACDEDSERGLKCTSVWKIKQIIRRDKLDSSCKSAWVRMHLLCL